MENDQKLKSLIKAIYDDPSQTPSEKIKELKTVLRSAHDKYPKDKTLSKLYYLAIDPSNYNNNSTRNLDIIMSWAVVKDFSFQISL
jgi:hypothetical protein